MSDQSVTDSFAPNAADSAASSRTTITLGGGCFWCLDAVYRELRGVHEVISGYTGGHIPSPSYEAVCAGITGHAEVVQVVFDPAELSLRDVLSVFFLVHDPTTLNRQGYDVGTQYRSAIFTHEAGQANAARSLIAELDAEHRYDAPIVTTVESIEEFWPAEAYHQDYFRKNPGQPYCQGVVAPKVAKARKSFFDKLLR